MGKRNKITTRDIAEYTGLSQSTVSMVLSKKQGVSFSPETVNIVEDAAKKLGYQKPKAGVKKKDHNLSSTIVIISPSYTNTYYNQLSHAITTRAKEKGYTTFVTTTLRDDSLEAEYLDLLERFDLAGIIFLSSPAKMGVANKLSHEMPCVLIGDNPSNCRFDCVELNNIWPAYMLGEHLIELGHTHITFIASPHSVNRMNRDFRIQGLRNALADHGIAEENLELLSLSKTNYRLLPSQQQEYENGYRLAVQAIENHSESTAFIGYNDTTAYGIMAAISDLGYRIPNDYSVCGFDNLPLSAMPQIALTTIEHSTISKGHQAVDIIDRKIQSRKNASESTFTTRMEYDPKLIVRKSSGRCKR